MAYSSAFNPDALPVNAEPEEAAQMFGRLHAQNQNQNHSQYASTTNSQPASHPASPHPNTQSNYYSKPPPPLPTQVPAQAPAPLNIRPGGAPSARSRTETPSSRPPQSPYGAGPTTPALLQVGGPTPASLQPGRPQPGNQNPPRRSSTPARMADASLFPLFKAVDRQGTGQLTEVELRNALLNGDYTTFDPATVRMMIRMHDHDRSGTIGFEEFCALWHFLSSWRTLFERFDEDNSGFISYEEYSRALVQFGYNLTPPFVTTLYRIYDKRGQNMLNFDLFVQSCLTLKRLTDVFKRYDTDRDGYIMLSFEEFLTEVLSQQQ